MQLLALGEGHRDLRYLSAEESTYYFVVKLGKIWGELMALGNVRVKGIERAALLLGIKETLLQVLNTTNNPGRYNFRRDSTSSGSIINMLDIQHGTPRRSSIVPIENRHQ